MLSTLVYNVHVCHSVIKMTRTANTIGAQIMCQSYRVNFLSGYHRGKCDNLLKGRQLQNTNQQVVSTVLGFS